jgi:hypothetical protein
MPLIESGQKIILKEFVNIERRIAGLSQSVALAEI